jgi:hypothetical protein
MESDGDASGVGKNLYPESTWQFTQRILAENNKSMGKAGALSKLISILGEYKIANISTDKDPYFERVPTLTQADAEKLIPLANEFSIRPQDVAMLFVIPEAVYWMKTHNVDQEQIIEIESQITNVKAKIFNALAICLPREFAIFAGMKESPLKSGREYSELSTTISEGGFRDFITSKINSDDPQYVFTQDGRFKYLNGLRTLRDTFTHEDWDPILDIVEKIIRNPDEVNGLEFENLMMAAHGTDMVMTTLVQSSDEDIDIVRALVAIHNSGMYGIRKSWNYLPIHIREKLAEQVGTLFTMADKLDTASDIRRTVNSILKPNDILVRVKLAKSVYDLESDAKQKELLKEELLKEGIIVEYKVPGDAIEFFDQFRKQKD